jgi:thioredoxin
MADTNGETAMSIDEVNFISITDDSFEEEVLKSPTPVIVVFASESSGSSYITLRQVQELVAEYEGRIKVGTMEVERNSLTTRQFRIRQVPTLLFFKNGLVVDYIIGTIRKRDLRIGIHDLLDGS